jgi:flagellar M-ring protein FliF
MKDVLTQQSRRAQLLFSGFTSGQKAITILAVLVLVVGGSLFYRWAAAPALTPLFSGLAAEDASAIVQELDGRGTKYAIADGGATVMVPRDQVYKLRLDMTAQGLPAGSRSGYSILDQQGITTSDFLQHVGYQRALEGELAKTIMSIQGITGASVHLALPEKDVFASQNSRPSASVLLNVSAGHRLTGEQVRAIDHLVASSVPRLVPEDVTIADTQGRVLSTGDEAGMDAASATREQQVRAYEDKLAASAQTMLDRITGAGMAVVRVNADLDFDRRNTRTQRYLYDAEVPPITQNESTESYRGAGRNPTGVLGPDNISVPGGAAGASEYEKRSTNTTNAVGSVVEDRVGAPGTVRRLTVAVLVDQRATAQVGAAQLEELVANAVGLDTSRGDTIQVEQLQFDTTGVDGAAAEAEAAAAAQKRAELMAMLRIGGVVLLVIAVLVLAFLSARSRREELGTEALAELEAQRQWLQAVREDAPAHALVGAGAPTSTDGRLALDAAPDEEAARRAALRGDIGTLIERQPEEVAQLLRGWLADRRQ